MTAAVAVADLIASLCEHDEVRRRNGSASIAARLSFDYTINDGHGHTASATVTVTVTVQAPVQDACIPITGFDKTWQGSVSSDWSHPDN